MKKIILYLCMLGVVIPSFAQKVEQLSEVFITATNYKYLNEIDSKEVAIPVELLERKVATFNLKDADFYQDEYDLYNVNFYIPEGKILAAYDKDGNILRTAERFKDINLPQSVIDAITERFPNWTISKNIYAVTYHDKKGAKKWYKLKLQNGEEIIRVKTDDDGNFL